MAWGTADVVNGGFDGVGFGLRPAVAGVVPVPAALHVRQAILLGVEHDKTLAGGDAVHPAAGGQRFGVLAAAVQHDEQGQGLVLAHAGRFVQAVATRPGGAESDTGGPAGCAHAGLFGGCRFGKQRRGAQAFLDCLGADAHRRLRHRLQHFVD